MPLDPPGISPNLQPDGTDRLRSAIVATILGDDDLSGIIGTRLFRNFIPQRSQNGQAAIVYTLISSIPDQTLDGPSGTVSASVQFSCNSIFSPDCDGSSKRLKSLFNGFTGLLNAALIVDDVTLTSELDLPEQPQNNTDAWTFRTVLDFQFLYRG